MVRSGAVGGAPSARRIGVLFPSRDPLSSANWSGTPRGIADGLRSLGLDVVGLGPAGSVAGVLPALRARLGDGSGAIGARRPARVATRTAALARSVRSAGPLDGIVAMGTDLYDLAGVRPSGVPTVTFDDATLAQQWREPASDVRSAGFPEEEVVRWCEQQARSSRAATACCVSTHWAAHSFVADYAVAPDRVRVVGIGHRPRAAAPGRDWTVPRFLFVGVDWERKNGDAVLRAFGRLRERLPAATLDLVGGHPPVDGLAGVRGHGLLARQDADAQAELDSLFAGCTAFVMPSRFDPAGIAYLEAASAGLPVIATTAGGAGEVLADGALTVHPGDDDGLLAAMVRLSAPAQAEEMGRRAAAASARLDWASVAGRVLAAFEPRSAEDGDDGI